MQQFANAREAALALRPDESVYCFHPEVLKADARRFMEMFPGKTAYAVKTNGEPIVLKALVEAGVTAFDVASPGEFAAVRAVSPDAEMLYMHPVKAQSDIRLALEKYGIRVIAVDHEDEITKLTRVVRALDIDPGAITVFVRVQTKGLGRLRAVEEIRRRAGLCGGTRRAAEPHRLQGRAVLSRRQPDRGSRHLRAGAGLGRLGAQPV